MILILTRSNMTTGGAGRGRGEVQGPAAPNNLPPLNTTDSSREWIALMCAVDFARPTPSGPHDIHEFLREDLPKPLPAFATELLSLHSDGDTADLASVLFQDSGSAIRLATRVEYVSL